MNNPNLWAKIPKEVSHVTEILEKAGFEAYLVGGCVRDLIIGLEPKDWDVTTNASPEQIQTLFPDSFYENDYGTVGVKTGSDDARLTIIEVTPYRRRYHNRSHKKNREKESGSAPERHWS